MAQNIMATMNIVLLVIFNRSHMGGSTILAAMSAAAIIDKQKAVSLLLCPKSARKKGTTILKFNSAT